MSQTAGTSLTGCVGRRPLSKVSLLPQGVLVRIQVSRTELWCELFQAQVYVVGIFWRQPLWQTAGQLIAWQENNGRTSIRCFTETDL